MISDQMKAAFAAALLVAVGASLVRVPDVSVPADPPPVPEPSTGAPPVPSTSLPPPDPVPQLPALDWIHYVGFVTVILVCIASFLWILTILWRVFVWARERIQARYRRTRQWISEMSPLLQAETPFTGERMVAASPLVPTKAVPSFQCEVWISDGAEFVKSGCGFRCSDNQIMTAYHVVAEASEVRLRTSHGDVDVGTRFCQLSGDIAVCTLGAHEMSKLQLSKPRLSACAVVRGTGTFGQIVAYGNQSMGMVMPYDAFGYVTYTGSTLHGFSGAPYYLGNCVLGMHIGAQAQNLGYDGSYLAALVKSTQESTQWLEKQVLKSKGRKLKATRSPYDIDEIFLMVNGQYHRVQVDSLTDSVLDGIEWVGEEPAVERESVSYTDSGKRPGALEQLHESECCCAGPWPNLGERNFCSPPAPVSACRNPAVHLSRSSQGYGWPNTDPCSVKKSLAVHRAKRDQALSCSNPPTQDEEAQVLARAEDLFSAWHFRQRLEEADTFDRCVDGLDMDSVPGYCELARLGSTNGQALKWNGVECDPERLRYFRGLVEQRIGQLERGDEAADDIKLFIKQEPHKIAKLTEGRYRLISAVSVVDSMVDRMLFSEMHDLALASACLTPSAVGWSPIRGGYRLVRARFPGRVLCADKSCWDWTVSGWMVDMAKELFKRLCLNPTERWCSLVDARFDMLFKKAVFRVSDGSRYPQLDEGLMKSGCYLTILMNTVLQSIVHLVASARSGEEPGDLLAMGDDTIQSVPRDLDAYLEALKGLGVLVKPKVLDYVEFAGFEFTEHRCVPAYEDKHRFQLEHLDEEFAVDTLTAYQLLYAHHPMLDEIRELLSFRCPSAVRSAPTIRRFFDG
nr:RNA-dependent RNA polymerase [Jilin luteo-like virus 2]